jgi:hypothetical protein
VSSSGVIKNCNHGFLNTQGMTSPANDMHIFLWQMGTIIPIQSMITHIEDITRLREDMTFIFEW